MQNFELMTTREVAAELSCSTRHVANLAKKEILEPVRKNPGRTGALIFSREEVENYRAMRELRGSGKGESK